MIASDDELGLRRWSGRIAKNGMHPGTRKPLYITGSPKSRDMIIQYITFYLVAVVAWCKAFILYNTICYVLVNRWDFIAINCLPF